MNQLFRVVVSFVVLCTLCSEQVFAASQVSQQSVQPNIPYSTNTQSTTAPFAGTSATQPTAGTYPQQGMVPQQGPAFLRDKLQQGTTMPGATGMTIAQPSVLLRAEVGDGLVKLSWKLQNVPSQLDLTQLRATVYYGQESEKTPFVQAVGSLDNTVIRELKNYQPYYFTVVVADRTQAVSLKSDEVRVIPLPQSEIGSKIETAFSKKALTLHDTIEAVPVERQLKQFGYDFFANTAQIAAVDSLPDISDYQVGPGDTLNLRVWGGVDLQLDLLVDRNGEVIIPKVGAVRLGGMSFEQARTTVNTALASYFRDFGMNLSMGRLRSIQVYVVGEVVNPGRYAVSSLGTVINALAAAGGPSRNGSLRTVRVNRGSKLVGQVDLYDMLLNGDRSKDVRLQNGDTIFVPVIGPVVAVAGEVRRPAIYELNGQTTLAQIMQMAGGIAASGYTGRVQVERIVDNQSRIALDYEPKGDDASVVLSSVKLQDRDMVKVFPVEEAVRQVVTLKGNVVRPGEYQLRKGMRLADLIPSTKALLPESYLDSVEITRLSPPDWRRELLTVSLRRVLEGKESDNILLQEQDAVRVFSRWEMEEKPRVAINGAVVNPGTYDYFPGMTVRDLVTAAGSPRRYALFEEAELSRIIIGKDKAAWTRIPLNLGKALAGDPSQNVALQQDDVLIVRSISEWTSATERLVALKGEVKYPGVYTIARGEKLSSLLGRAGGFTDKAYLRGAKFTRQSVREQQQQRMDEMIAKTEQQVARKQSELASVAASKEELAATQASLEALAKSLEKLKLLKAEGRVVIALSPVDELKKTSSNIELEAGDTLEVPERPGTVAVMGQVYNQTAFIYQPEDNDVSSYLAKAGGPTSDADKSEMYVVKADGTVFSNKQTSIWSFGGFDSNPLLPGDTLVVPQKLERIAWMREIKDITQILANIAVAAGTIWIGLK